MWPGGLAKIAPRTQGEYLCGNAKKFRIFEMRFSVFIIKQQANETHSGSALEIVHSIFTY